MRIPTVAELEAAITARGWVVHQERARLNIVLLRRTPGRLDAFDDMLVVFWTDGAGRRQLWACRCTTEPGRPSREHPTRADGTAVWAVSQLVDGFRLGEHHAGTPQAYPALVPVVPVPVLRYTSVDDPTGTPSTSTACLLHRASADHESTVVGPWSEGCAVVANPTDYAFLLGLARGCGWPRFTISLLEWAA